MTAPPPHLLDIYPLTAVQSGMLFDMLDDRSDVYVGQFTCTIRGAVDPDSFKAAWTETAKRHEILRATVVWEGLRAPVLAIGSAPRIDFENHDFRDVAEVDRDTAFKALTAERQRRVTRTAKSGGMDIVLVRDGPKAWRLVWTYPQFLLDGWSVSALLREVFQRCAGQVPTGPATPFKSYIQWRQSRDQSTAKQYWRERLDGFAGTATLPPFADTALKTPKVDRHELLISPDRTQALQIRASRCGATIATLLHAAWALLLSSYLGSDDILFGSVMSDRPPELPGADRIIGHMLSTPPIRIKCPDRIKVGHWLRGIQRQLLEIRDHGHLGLGTLRPFTGIPQDQPFFQSMLTIENYPNGIWRSDARDGFGFDISAAQFHEQTGLPLTLIAVPLSTLVLNLSHDPALVSKSVARQMLRQLDFLVDQLAGEPDRCLGDLPRLPPDQERAAIFTGQTAPVTELVPQRFLRNAQEAPDATAVIDMDGQTLTYRDLEQRSASLARRLRAAGCARGDRVGLLHERGAGLAVSLLAIIRAGASAVPLSSEIPATRCDMILRDAKAKVLLGQNALVSGLNLDSLCFIDADDEADIPSIPLPGIGGTDEIYLLYTSGSTGKPKGVICSHHGLATTFAHFSSMLETNPGDRLLSVCLESFDMGIWELLFPLWFGGTVVIAPSGTRLDGGGMAAAIDKFDISILQTTPSVLRILADADWSGRDGVKVVTGGEPLPAALAQSVLRRGVRLWNGYGPCECSIYAAIGEVLPESTTRAGAMATNGETVRSDRGPAIGSAIDNSFGLLLGPDHRPVPPGVPGEYHVGGAIVGPGYLDNPRLTAEKFTPMPRLISADLPGTRCYASGDQMRRSACGSLVPVGRLDAQVKIHGYRLELTEIEALLEAHPAVASAAVVHCKRHDGHDDLVAWVVPDSGIAATALRASTLPADVATTDMADGTELALPYTDAVRHEALWDRLVDDRDALRLGQAMALDLGPGLFGIAAGLAVPRLEVVIAPESPEAAECAQHNVHVHVLDGRVSQSYPRPSELPDFLADFPTDKLHLLCVDLPGPADPFLAQMEAHLPGLRFARISCADLKDSNAVRARLQSAGLDVEMEEGAHTLRATRLGLRAGPAAPSVNPMGRPQLRAELREWLAARLPEAVLPRGIGFLPQLLLTRNGKIDRDALANRDLNFIPAQAETTGDASALAVKIAGLFAQVLECQSVSIDDSFFNLGGDSILAILLTSRAREIGVTISPQLVFSYPTPVELANVATLGTVPAPEPVLGPVPLLPAQRWFFAQAFHNQHHWNQGVRLRCRGRLDLSHLRKALGQIVKRHDALRSRFHLGQDQWLAEIAGPDNCDATLCIVEKTEDASDMLADAHASLDIGHGPLVSAVVLRGGTDADDVLELFAHHLVVDAVSWRVILEDLATILAAPDDESPDPPSPTTPVGVHARRLRAQAQESPEALGQAHWLQIAKETADLASAPLVSGPTDWVDAMLPDITAAQLAAAAQHAGESEWTLIVAALALARARSGANGLVVLEGHGRDAPIEGNDLSRTVGWFTGFFPANLDLKGEMTPTNAVEVSRGQLHAAPAVGFGALLAWGDDKTKSQLAALPVPELSLNFLGSAARIPDESPFSLTEESPGPLRATGQHRAHAFELELSIETDQIALTIACPEDRLDEARTLAKELGTALADICSSMAESDSIKPKLPPDADDMLREMIPQIEDVYPLTVAQQGILFGTLFDPRSALYVNEFRWTLSGDFDCDVFRAAWQAALLRHPILRTSVHHQGLTAPVQVVHRKATLPFDYLDLSDEADWAGRLEAMSRKDLALGFDLARPPLIRLRVARLPEGDHRIIWGLHHIALDGWCIDLLLGEVFENYSALAEGRPVPERPEATPFRTYVDWERRQDIGRAKSAWRSVLSGFRSSVPLPGDLAPDLPAGGEVDAAGLSKRTLPPYLREALLRFSRRQGLTLGTLAQAVWAIILHGQTGARDVVAAVTHAGRPAELPGIETMIGMFVKSRVLRCRLTPQTALLPWLHALQRQQVALRRYDFCALSDIQSWSDMPQGQPLATSLVLYQNVPRQTRPDDEKAALSIKDEEAYVRNDFPLTFRFLPGEPMELHLLFDRRRFSEATIAVLAEQAETLLSRMTEHPSARLGDLVKNVETVSHARRKKTRGELHASLRDALA